MEREEELKRERDAISVLAEKVRLEQLSHKKATDKFRDKQDEDSYSKKQNPLIAVQYENLQRDFQLKEQEVEHLSLKLSNAENEINQTKNLLKQT